MIPNKLLEMMNGNIDSLLQSLSNVDEQELLNDCREYLRTHKFIYVKETPKRQRVDMETIIKDPRFVHLSSHERVCILGALHRCGDIDYLFNQIERAKVDHGTCVGVLAAQSISEQLTQTTLNVFHLAGAKKSMAGGMKRLNELLEVSVKPSQPVITKIADPTDALLDKRYSRIADSCAIRYDSGYIVEIVVGDKHYDFPQPAGCSIKEAKQAMTTILAAYREGIPGVEEIDDGILYVDPNDYDRSAIQNKIYDVLWECSPESLHTYRVNDVHYIYETLGIAAAESYLVGEIMDTLGAEGIHVNIRHINMLVANMTFRGVPLPNTYNGCKNFNNVVLRATFQQGTETFAQAAAYELEDKLNDVSAQILMGMAPKVGTNMVHLVELEQVQEHYEVPYATPESPVEETTDSDGQQEYFPCESEDEEEDIIVQPQISLVF